MRDSQLIERIKTRCDEVGDCWEWTGATQTRSRVPVMRYEGNTTCVRRVLAIALGHDLGAKVATYKCGNQMCCNPAHLTVMTKTTLQKRTNKVNVYYMHPTRRQRVAAARRAKSKLDKARVQEIREDQRPQREIAAAHGIAQTTVSRIKRGQIWRDYTDVFGFIGMQVTA